MQKICLLACNEDPVPAVKGGAIAELIQLLIDENEINYQFDFTVLTVQYPEAEILANKYKHTKFIYFSKNIILNKFYWRIYKYGNMILKNKLSFPLQAEQSLNYLKKNAEQFDYFIVYGTDASERLVKYIPRKKILYHLHWCPPALPKETKSFEYLLSVSNFIAKDYINKTNISPNRVKVWKNCINTEKFAKVATEEEKSALRKDFNIKQNDFVILFTGRIIPEKGVKELLIAMKQLPPDVKLLLVGSAKFGIKSHSAYEDEVATLVQELGERVAATGFVHNSQLYKYYGIANIAILPSKCPEAAPLTIIECATAGMPIIATKMGGIPEYLGDNCGVLINSDENLSKNIIDVVMRLKNNQEECQYMSNTAKKYSENFSIRKYFEDFCNIINEIEDGKNE